MALKPIPDAAIDLIVFHDITLSYENQAAVNALYSERFSVINRGHPRWIGTVRMKPTYDRAVGLAVERWILSFQGQANTFLIPLSRPSVIARPTIEDGEVVTVSGAANSASGVLVHTMSNTDALTDEMFVKAANHLYRVESVSGSSVILNPQRVIATGTVLEPAEFVEGFLETPQYPDNPMVATADANIPQFGPWLIDYRTM